MGRRASDCSPFPGSLRLGEQSADAGASGFFLWCLRGVGTAGVYHPLMEPNRTSGFGVVGLVAAIILIVVIGLALLYAYRALSPAS